MEKLLARTPTRVVPEIPKRGMMTKPETSTPIAAPTVFTA
jgi:hypothetical protein